jgi:hypothetical protein
MRPIEESVVLDEVDEEVAARQSSEAQPCALASIVRGDGQGAIQALKRVPLDALVKRHHHPDVDSAIS